MGMDRLRPGKILHEIDMGNYDESMSGQKIFVWVNLPRSKMRPYWDWASLDVDESKPEEIEAAAKGLFEWLADVWGQGDEEFTAEEIESFHDEIGDTDPQLMPFLLKQTAQAIIDYRVGQRKK